MDTSSADVDIASDEITNRDVGEGPESGDEQIGDDIDDPEAYEQGLCPFW